MAPCRSMSSFLLGPGRGDGIASPSLTQQPVAPPEGVVAAEPLLL